MYAHLLRVLRSEVDTQQLAAVLAAAQGAQVEAPPTFAEAQARLDELLSAPLVSLADDPQAQLRDALGLRAG